MRRRIEFPLDDGSPETVVVEVEQPADPGLERVARPGAIERADESFDAAIARIRPAVGKVLASVRGLAQAPDDVTVEFGIKFDAKSGVILTSVGLEANLKVTVAWHAPPSAATN